MADGSKAVINLTVGMEDPERVTVAFLMGGAALEQGKSVVMFLTKDAVKLTLPGTAQGEACEGCPPLERLYEQYEAAGGELWACPYCFNSRGLDESAMVGHSKIAGGTPLWEWIGEGATVFSF
jgi:predicted peroxiredoxin